MFTGIVTAVGTLMRVDRLGEKLALTVEAPYPDLEVGESVAVGGACLTVVETGEGWFRVEAVVTTRGRTRFAELEPGTRLNLERALQVGERLGGHMVQGHVDGVGAVRDVRDEADARLVDLAVPEEVAELVVPIGSITVEGVSLTVNAIPKPGTVQVSLIPFTCENTTLGDLAPGDRVHLEADLVGKYVRQFIQLRDER